MKNSGGGGDDAVKRVSLKFVGEFVGFCGNGRRQFQQMQIGGHRRREKLRKSGAQLQASQPVKYGGFQKADAA